MVSNAALRLREITTVDLPDTDRNCLLRKLGISTSPYGHMDYECTFHHINLIVQLWACCCSSVCSQDISMVVSVCEFLTDVVFQDFPAEVFLQRPSIVKVDAAVVFVFYHTMLC